MIAALVDSTDAALPYYTRVVGMTPLPRQPSHRFHPMILPLLGWAARGRPSNEALRVALPPSKLTAHARALARIPRVIEAIDAPDKYPTSDEVRSAVRSSAPPALDDEVLAELHDSQATLAALQSESDARVAELLRR